MVKGWAREVRFVVLHSPKNKKHKRNGVHC